MPQDGAGILKPRRSIYIYEYITHSMTAFHQRILPFFRPLTHISTQAMMTREDSHILENITYFIIVSMCLFMSDNHAGSLYIAIQIDHSTSSDFDHESKIYQPAELLLSIRELEEKVRARAEKSRPSFPQRRFFEIEPDITYDINP